jgi:hypothetical protein
MGATARASLPKLNKLRILSGNARPAPVPHQSCGSRRGSEYQRSLERIGVLAFDQLELDDRTVARHIKTVARKLGHRAMSLAHPVHGMVVFELLRT